jgi:hypothetical protein
MSRLLRLRSVQGVGMLDIELQIAKLIPGILGRINMHFLVKVFGKV